MGETPFSNNIIDYFLSSNAQRRYKHPPSYSVTVTVQVYNCTCIQCPVPRMYCIMLYTTSPTAESAQCSYKPGPHRIRQCIPARSVPSKPPPGAAGGSFDGTEGIGTRLDGRKQDRNTPFRILNQHLFIRLRLVAVDFVTLALVVNRGSWFRQLHANVTYMHHRSTWVIVLTKGIQF